MKKTTKTTTAKTKVTNCIYRLTSPTSVRYRVQKTINGNSFSKNFTKLKDAKSYLTTLS